MNTPVLTKHIPLFVHVLTPAHNPETGRLDAERLGQLLGLGISEMARALGRTPQGLRKNPASESLQPQLARVVLLVTRLRELLSDNLEYVRMWLHAPHPDLGGRTPLSYLEEQKIETLEQMVEMAELGQMG